MRELIKQELIKLFGQNDWESKIDNFHSYSRIDIIWIMSDFVKEKQYVKEALQIAKVYVNDPDPKKDDRTNMDLLEGKETNYIVTTRGSLCWLINAIVATLDSTYYSEIVDLLEKLTKDPVHYVRQQSTYPLAGLMLNIRAIQDNDKKPWGFTQQDKDRVVKLAFDMLSDNKDYPRVIDSLTQVFDKRRFVDDKEAIFILNNLLYQKEKSFYPEYVLRDVAPLLIFFAEFAKDHTPTFDNTEIQKLLEEVILSAPVGMKTTVVWHMWKTIEDNVDTYNRFKKYIDLFFKGEFAEESLTQYEFFIEKLMVKYPYDAVNFFLSEVEYIQRGLSKLKPEPGGRMLFFNAQRLVESVAELRSERLYDVLWVIKEIVLRQRYVGNVPEIFSSYKKAPQNLQKELAQKIDPMVKEMEIKFPYLFSTKL